MLLLFMCNDFKRALVSVCKLFWHSISFFPSHPLSRNSQVKINLFYFFSYCHWHVLFSFFFILSTETLWYCYFSLIGMTMLSKKMKTKKESLLLLHISMTSLLWSYGILYSFLFFFSLLTFLMTVKEFFSFFW